MAFKWAKITGKLTVVVADSTDTGEEPDEVPCDAGEVDFIPQVKRVQAFGRFVTPQTITATVSTDGTLSLNGVPELLILDLGDPSLPVHIARTGTNSGAYQVVFRSIRSGGKPVTLDPFYINPNADDNDQPSGVVDPDGNPVQKNDLSILAPLPGAGGSTAIVVGPQGPPGLIQGLVQGTNVQIDATDPAHPKISATAGDPDTTGATDGQVYTFNGTTGTATWEDSTGFTPPPDGIPKSELAEDVQTSLGKADTAVPTSRLVAGQALDADIPAATLKASLALAKADVGLDQVDNTSDASKPVSADQQAALDDKADLSTGHVPVAQATIAVTLTVVSTTTWPARPTTDGTNVHVRWVDAGGLGTEPDDALDGDSLVAAS